MTRKSTKYASFLEINAVIIDLACCYPASRMNADKALKGLGRPDRELD